LQHLLRETVDLIDIDLDPQPFESEDIMRTPRFVLATLLGLTMMFGALGISQADARPEAVGFASDDSARSLTFETYRDQKEGHRWRLKATNGQIIATSGQGYKDKRDCEHSIDVIKKGAEKAKVQEAK
jgi:uncharacterized protein YegP (UPF0339 family)